MLINQNDDKMQPRKTAELLTQNLSPIVSERRFQCSAYI